MEFIADQAIDMRRGQRVDRQRFGVTSALRARTVSLDVVREVCPDEYWDTQVDGYDEWADPTADAALRRIDGEDVTHAQH